MLKSTPEEFIGTAMDRNASPVAGPSSRAAQMASVYPMRVCKRAVPAADEADISVIKVADGLDRSGMNGRCML